MSTLEKEADSDWLKDIKELTITRMTNQAQTELNPKHYQLSGEERKRLRWLYLLYSEQAGNVTIAADKVGLNKTKIALIECQLCSVA